MTGRPVQSALLIAGVSDDVHVGRHLATAARAANRRVELLDTRGAFTGPRVLRTLSWRLCGHRPPRLARFSGEVVSAARALAPAAFIATGLAPVNRRALGQLREMGIRTGCFLTDDPWSASHRSPWFMKALPEYDRVFSPRRSNLDDLRRAGCREVSYLPFGYAPDIHFPEPPDSDEERERFAADVVFVGGADEDRRAWIKPAIDAGLRVALWGGYWDRYPETRAHYHGFADSRTVRKAIGGATTALCVVRKANRDGHSMRSIEVPAIGACMIVEDTAEHREFFGPDSVIYVSSPYEAREAIVGLLEQPDRVRHLAAAVHARITSERHQWGDRLQSMMEMLGTC